VLAASVQPRAQVIKCCHQAGFPEPLKEFSEPLKSGWEVDTVGGKAQATYRWADVDAGCQEEVGLGSRNHRHGYGTGYSSIALAFKLATNVTPLVCALPRAALQESSAIAM